MAADVRSAWFVLYLCKSPSLHKVATTFGKLVASEGLYRKPFVFCRFGQRAEVKSITLITRTLYISRTILQYTCLVFLYSHMLGPIFSALFDVSVLFGLPLTCLLCKREIPRCHFWLSIIVSGHHVLNFYAIAPNAMRNVGEEDTP